MTSIGQAVEAIEVAEAAKVNEAAEVSKAWKTLMRTSKSSRFLNSIIRGLRSIYFDVLETIFMMGECKILERIE